MISLCISHRQYQEVVRAILDKQRLKLERDNLVKELAIIMKERDILIPVSLTIGALYPGPQFLVISVGCSFVARCPDLYDLLDKDGRPRYVCILVS